MRLHALSMSMVRSIVYGIALGLVAIPSTGNCDPKKLPDEDGDKFGSAVKFYQHECPQGEKTPGKQDECKQKAKELWETMVTGAGAADCAKAEQDQATAKGVFLSSCRAMGRTGGAIGIRECLKRKNQCDQWTSNNASRTFVDSDGLPNVATARQQAEMCPESTTNDDSVKEDIRRAEDRVDKLKEKMPKMMEEVTEAQSAAQKEIAKQEDAATQAVDDFEKEKEEANKAGDDAETQNREKINQLNARASQIEAEIRKQDLSKSEATMMMEDAKMNVRLSCNQQAVQLATKEMEEKIAKARANVDWVGDMRSLMKRAGISNRQFWKRRATDYYKECINADNATETRAGAERRRNAAHAQAEVNKSALRMERNQIEQQILQIQNPNACGQNVQNANGTTNETESCKAFRRKLEKLQAAEGKMRRKQAQAARNAQRETAAANQKAAGKAAALGEAMRDKGTEEARLQKLRELQGIKAVVGGSKKTAEDFPANYGKWAGAAIALDQCCLKGKATEQVCMDNANDLLVGMGQSFYATKRGLTPESIVNRASAGHGTGGSTGHYPSSYGHEIYDGVPAKGHRETP